MELMPTFCILHVCLSHETCGVCVVFGIWRVAVLAKRFSCATLPYIPNSLGTLLYGLFSDSYKQSTTAVATTTSDTPVFTIYMMMRMSRSKQVM
jgi:hypothetical protein